MTSRAVRASFAAWIAALSAVYYAFPGSHVVTWTLIGLSGA